MQFVFIPGPVLDYQQKITITDGHRTHRLFYRIFIIKFRMRKNLGQSDEYNLRKKHGEKSQNQTESLIAGSQSRYKKNESSTGNNSSRIKRQNSKQQKLTKDATPSMLENPQASKPEREDDQTKASKQQSNISNRFSTVGQLQNQIQRISAELAKKNEQIRLIYKSNQKKKAQIIDLEKNVSYYEGRLSMMEDQLKSYEEGLIRMSRECDERAKYESQVEQLVKLFEGMRKQNEILSGKYEEKCYQLNKLTDKYIKLKNKLRNEGLTRDLSKDPVKKSLDNKVSRVNPLALQARTYQATQDDRQRQNLTKDLTSKIESIEVNLYQISKQNERLFGELDQKDHIISKLKKEIGDHKLHRKSSKSLRRSLRVSNPKRSSGESSTLTATKTEDEYQLGKAKSSSRSPDPQISSILRKLKYNLLAQEKDSEYLINKLTSFETKAEDLTKGPFGLSFEESDLLVQWVNELQTEKREVRESGTSTQEEEREVLAERLRRRIGKFRSILTKQQYILKVQIYNTMLNRESELADKIKQQPVLDHHETRKYFKEWGLNEQEVDVILKGFYEWTGETQKIDLGIVQQIVYQWHSL